MPLADNARKEAQIKEINRISAVVDALVAFAQGDETALDGLTTVETATPSNVIDFAKLNTGTPAFVGQITVGESPFKTQPAGVPDCPLCGAAGGTYHTPGDKACVARQADAVRNAAPAPSATWTPGTAFVPVKPPAEFAPSSEDENE